MHRTRVPAALAVCAGLLAPASASAFATDAEIRQAVTDGAAQIAARAGAGRDGWMTWLR